MGTTVTTNLALIKPDTNESIKQNLPTFNGWAAQNAVNMDTIDGLFKATNTTGTLTWGATTTPPTLGSGGFAEQKILRLWPRMVIIYYRIFAGGAGFAAGSGSYTLTLPFAVDPSFSAFSQTLPVGKMIFQDNSAALTSSVFSLIYSPTSALLFARPSEGGTWNNTTPVVPAQNDRFSGYAIIPTAA